MPKVVVNNMPTDDDEINEEPDDELQESLDILEEMIKGQEIPEPPTDDSPDEGWVLKVSPEESKDLMDYLNSLNELITEQPPKRNPPTKKWNAWNDKIQKLNAKYKKELSNFAMACASVSGVLDDDYAKLIKEHLSTQNSDSSTDSANKKDNKPKQLEQISKKPKQYLMPNTNLATSMPGRYDPKTDELIPIVGAGPFDLPALSRPHQITNYTVISVDENVKINSKQPFTANDLCNMNAVCSLYEAGNRIITAEMVHRAKANQTDTEYTKPQTLAEEEESLEKMRHIFVRCDITSELIERNKEREKRGLKPLKIDSRRPNRYEINDYLLNLRKEEIQAGSTTVTGYYIEAEPILLSHAKTINQLITIPIKFLDIKEVKNGMATTVSIPNTTIRQPVKEYLLRRIQIMKRDAKNKKHTQSHTILFESVYREAGIDKTVKQYTNNVRKYVLQCLDFWVAEKFIASYTISKKGNQIYGIEISLITQ